MCHGIRQPPGPCLGQGSRTGWAVLKQGLWGSPGDCSALVGALCCPAGDPRWLWLCIPVLPRGEARGLARGQQDPSRGHGGIHQPGQPQGHRWVWVCDTCWSCSCGGAPWAGAPRWHCWHCCFPGIHMHQELGSYLGCSRLPLDGCCIGTCQVTQ